MCSDLEALTALAKAGDADAQYKLGNAYYCGLGSIRFSNADGAAYWYEKAAKQGHVEAQMEMFEMYSDKLSCHKWDYKKALFWLNKAVESGNAEAQYKLGKTYIDGFICNDSKGYSFEINPEEGVKWLLRSAENGYFLAMEALGDCYINGIGVQKDDDKGVEWYKKASDSNSDAANFKLGELYYLGERVEQSYEKAIGYFRMCYNPAATKRLGDCYYFGYGVERDLHKAEELYDTAARCDDMGFHGARAAVALIYAGDGPLHNDRKAVKWLQSVKNFVENAEVFFEIAKRHLTGYDFRDERGYERDVIRKDPESAAHYFKRASDLGHIRATFELGNCYFNGRGVEQDKEKAKTLWEQAAEKGCKEAEKALADNFK